MKHCDSCGQEKPCNPSARPRSKARGFYDWQCWDCYKGSVSRRRDRSMSSPERQALHEREVLAKAVLETVRQEIYAYEEAQKQKNREAQQTRKRLAEEARQAASQHGVGKKFVTKNGETLIRASPPFLVMVQEAQKALEARPQDLELQHKLQVAQNKLAKFGPDAFDFRAAE